MKLIKETIYPESEGQLGPTYRHLMLCPLGHQQKQREDDRAVTPRINSAQDWLAAVPVIIAELF